MKLVSCFFGLAFGQGLFGGGGGGSFLETAAYSSLLANQGSDFATLALLGGTDTPFGRAAISNQFFGGGLGGALITDQFVGGGGGGGYYGGRQQQPDFATTYALSGLLGGDTANSALPLLALGGGSGQVSTALKANLLGGGIEGAYLATQLDNNNNNNYRPYRPYAPAAYVQPTVYTQPAAYVQPTVYTQPTIVQPSAYASVYPTTFSQTLYPTTFSASTTFTQPYTPATWNPAPYATVATTLPSTSYVAPTWNQYATVATTLPSTSYVTATPAWNQYATVATTLPSASYVGTPTWNQYAVATTLPTASYATTTTLPTWNSATVGVATPYTTVGVSSPLAPVWNPPSTIGVGATVGLGR